MIFRRKTWVLNQLKCVQNKPEKYILIKLIYIGLIDLLLLFVFNLVQKILQLWRKKILDAALPDCT